MIDYGKLDASLMAAIHTYKPYGFAYSVYEIDASGPVRKGSNGYGHRKPNHDFTIHSVTEMDSMSKTVTAIGLLKWISKIPEVKSAYNAAKSTPAGSAAWATWSGKVDHYLDHKLQHLMPPKSQSGIDWNNLAAAKTITLRQLLLHTSGLHDHGDDPTAVEKSLKQWTATTTQMHYSNPNYDLFRYILPVFANKYVATQPLLAAFEALWGMPFIGPQLFELNIGALYAVLIEDDVMNIFPSSSRPGIQPWGSQVEFANAAGTKFWDIMNDVGPWSTLCGSWGWKMSTDQYAKLIASCEAGIVFPKEYWSLMTQSADAHGYGYAIATAGSAHASVNAIGTFYTHNGGDGYDDISGGGFWLSWGPIALAVRINSPFSGKYGIHDGTDNTGANLWSAVDNALAASLT